MAKRTEYDTLDCDVEPRLASGLSVKLSNSVRGDVSMLRRLHYRLVDIMVDGGFVKWLADDAEMRLEALSSEILTGYVVALMNETRYAPKKSKKSKKSKKTAKRGSK